MEFVAPWILALFSLREVVAPVAMIGLPAPDLRLPGTDGKTHRLSDFRGKKPVVLVWYPALPT